MAEKSRLAGDVWGGAAAMLVALPSAIAYGVVSFTPLGSGYLGVGAMAGMIGTVILGIVAPLVGGAPRLITAPCAPAAAVLSALCAELLAGRAGQGGVSAEQALLLVALVGLLAGILQILFAIMGGGKIIKYIPYPVVSGYLSGVGTLIFLSQVPKLLGLPKATSVWIGLLEPSVWQWNGIAVGIVTIVGMSQAGRVTKAIPAPIVGLLAGMGTYFLLGLWQPELYRLADNTLLIGPIVVEGDALMRGLQERWQVVGQMGIGELMAIMVPSLTLAVLLSIDTLKTCVVVDALTRSRHQSNRTLLGQGLSNLLSALLGGMPGAGTMGATLVSLNSGGQTRLSGLLEGLFSLLVLWFFAGLIGWVPIAALAGILMVVGWRMFDWQSLHLLHHRSTLLDFGVIAAVVVVAVFGNLVAAAGAGIGFAVLLFLREQVRSSVVRRRRHGDQVSSKYNRLREERDILQSRGRESTICELQGSLFFGTTDQLFTSLEKDIKQCRFLVLDLRHVQSIDFTAVHMLELIAAMLKDRGAWLILSDVPSHLPTGLDMTQYFAQTGLLHHGENIRIFPYLDLAMEWVEEHLLQEGGGVPPQEEPLLQLSEIALLRGLLDGESMAILERYVEERHVKAGERVFSRGDEGDEIFFIRRGQIRISLPTASDGTMSLAIFGQGDFFGEMVFLELHHRMTDAVTDVTSLHNRSTDAVADVATDLYFLSRRRFDQAVAYHPELGFRIIFRLARALSFRLRLTSAELRELKEL
ncbi:MAG: SLC26A/SulP transporter family protein [Magnetococcales bacterium]|nr:SLC26A/SulP transporter family protein [Magnetococcales bacterium]MBF0117057.1 SLC26A/SulP transporter family protein [Magnetococcales bacterium]